MLRRFRRKPLVSKPVTSAETRLLAANLAVFARLTAVQRSRLVRLARVIASEKHWEGCGGLSLTDDMKLIIAAQAALLLLGMDVDPAEDAVYPNVQSILVYPAGFVSPSPRVGPGGVVTEGQANLGEAHLMGQTGGPVIVSWRDALEGGLDAGDGRNLVLHEFAHKLDFMDGASNGTPILETREQLERWTRVMTAHYEDLVRRARLGAPSVLSYYGATNPAEFFAVATEAYFERGAEMRAQLPGLYEVLRDYYGWEAV